MSNQASSSEKLPKIAQEAVLTKSDPHFSEGKQVVKGYDFDQGINYEQLFQSYKSIGFQATNLGKAIDEINKMISWRLSDEPMADDETEPYNDLEVRKNTKCKIFFGYTSNMISCGIRETIRFLVQHRMIDCIVTTCGGIEEDFIKCLAPTFIGDFELKGSELRKKGINRIGNLLVPNDNYCKFEDWLVPILDKLLKEQKNEGAHWTPSKVIARLGKEINNPESVYYWAYKNDIPVFCPAFTDGSIGDILYFHSFNNPGLIIDLVEDIRLLNSRAVFAKKTGMIVLGGGVVKHHVCNANLMRNGADFSVFVNTAQEFDGSDAGARPDEAVSWGKIRAGSSSIKVFSDATLVFPIMVAESFAKHYENQTNKKTKQ